METDTSETEWITLEYMKVPPEFTLSEEIIEFERKKIWLQLLITLLKWIQSLKGSFITYHSMKNGKLKGLKVLTTF